VLAQIGYPAGMPRRMSVPLAGLPPALRLRTNQEIYWDRVEVVQAEPLPQARRTALPLVEARLSVTCFARRSTGPQHQTHYYYARRSPLWDTHHPAGYYTDFGPVTELLVTRDDATAIICPGEELQLEFAAELPPLPASWNRRFDVEAHGWAKDMDLYTAQGAKRWSRCPHPGWRAMRALQHPLPRRPVMQAFSKPWHAKTNNNRR
jgi:hypothetical protein